MSHAFSLTLPWDPRDVDQFLALGRLADASGVHTIWVNEGFGHDAFSGLALLARETERVRLGTSVVNVYSRTPGALAQHFATLDQLSKGRVTVGFGTSGAGVIERFHGMPYQPSIGRLREVVSLFRSIWKHERVSHAGHWYSIERGLPMGIEPVQPEPPVYLATLHPRSVALTAEIADGWLPAWIPLERLRDAVTELRSHAVAVVRGASAVTVRAPSTVSVVEDANEAAAIRTRQKHELAFFVARNGEFYYRQFVRHGLADEAAAIRRAWSTGGAEEAVRLIGDELVGRFHMVGSLDQCRRRIEEQAEAGVDLHQLSLSAIDPKRWPAVIEALGGA